MIPFDFVLKTKLIGISSLAHMMRKQSEHFRGSHVLCLFRAFTFSCNTLISPLSLSHLLFLLLFLAGIILRHQLITLIKYRHWDRDDQPVGFNITEMQFSGSMKTQMDSLVTPENAHELHIDLTNYVDTTVITAKQGMPLSRAYDL